MILIDHFFVTIIECVMLLLCRCICLLNQLLNAYSLPYTSNSNLSLDCLGLAGVSY